MAGNDLMLVTIKLPKNPEHDPRNKKTGLCPVSPTCTDVTGEHHTVVARTVDEVEELREKFGHITRIEKVADEWVTKEAELDALPEHSYVRGYDGFKHAKVSGGKWVLCVEFTRDSHEARSIELPAQVLYRG